MISSSRTRSWAGNVISKTLKVTLLFHMTALSDCSIYWNYRLSTFVVLQQESMGCWWLMVACFMQSLLWGGVRVQHDPPHHTALQDLWFCLCCMWLPCMLHVCVCNHRGRELRIWFFEILCPVRLWGYPELRHHTHGGGAPRPCQVPSSGLYGSPTQCSRKNAAAPTAAV